MSLVELVNVPETFVSSNPFYVNSNVKQIKPFLLVVQVQPDAADATAGAVAGPSNLAAGAPGAQVGRPGAAVGMTGGMTATGATKVPKAVVKTGRTFKHDPALLMQPSWYGQPLEVVSINLIMF